MSGPELKRALGLPSAVLLIVGSVIGSGVFLKPLRLASALPTEGWILGTWIGIGLVCFAGALAFAELGAMLPSAGGPYAYLRAAYGPFPAFLYGWCLFFVINPGTIAALAVAFGDNLALFLGTPATFADPLAFGMIIALAIVNHLGVQKGTWLQNVSTVAKLAALLAIIAGGLALAFGDESSRKVAVTTPPAGDIWAGLGAAAVAIFWAYEGWHQIAFSAAELKRPSRDIPLAVFIGMSILVAGYTLVNIAYFAVIPHGEMQMMAGMVPPAAPSIIPETFFSRVFGEGAARGFVLLLALSVLGAANPNFLSTSRSFWAMAKEGDFPRVFSHLSPRFQTPVLSIWAQAALSIGLVLVLRGFDDLTDYVITIALLFFALAVAAVLVLRRQQPDLPRPFRCPLATVCVVLFVATAAFVEVQILRDPEGQKRAFLGLGFAGLGAVAWVLRSRIPSKKL